MSESPRELAQNFVLDRDAAYAEKWLSDAVMWSQLGVYERVASVLNLDNGSTHLDMGCGLGHLLGMLKLRERNATLFGVDRNPFMIWGAVKLLSQVNISAFACISTRVDVEDDGYIRRYYEFHPDMAYQNPAKDGEVTMVSDDFRNMSLFEKLLGDREISSVSFVMPGTSSVGIYEFPYNIQRLEAIEEKRRTTELMQDTRRAAFEYAARKLNSGGVFVVAERIAYLSGEIGLVANNIQGAMGKVADCFDFEGKGSFLADVTDVYSQDENTEWTTTRTQLPLITGSTSSQVAGMFIFVGKFVRNEKEFI